LTIDHILEKCLTNPRRIFRLPAQPETWIEIDEDASYEIRAADHFTRCGWTPFEGWKARGRVRRVVLRGNEVFKDGKVIGQTGTGRDLRVSG
jgi:carbamoyl-phosphate synthase/aspartate carbamoyltransferase/dihydroorotase